MQDDIVQDFIDESRELIQLAEKRLITLEQAPSSDAVIADLFRIIHTIKGNSRFLELKALETIAHAAEMVLDAFRHHRLTADGPSIGLLLSALDAISDEVGALAGDNDAAPERSHLVQALSALAASAAPKERIA